MFVNIGGKCSTMHNNDVGVPQGSVLGLLFMNDLPYCFSSNTSIVFVDGVHKSSRNLT